MLIPDLSRLIWSTKNVKRSFKLSEDPLVSTTDVNIHLDLPTLVQRIMAGQLKLATERQKVSSRLSNVQRSLICAREAGLYWSFDVYLGVLALPKHVYHARIMVHWSGLNRIQKNGGGWGVAIGGDSG